jgi:hypothetical protein
LVVAASEFGALNEACVRPRGGLCRVGGVEGRREAGEGERQARARGRRGPLRAVAGERPQQTPSKHWREETRPLTSTPYALRPTPYTLHATYLLYRGKESLFGSLIFLLLQPIDSAHTSAAHTSAALTSAAHTSAARPTHRRQPPRHLPTAQTAANPKP